MKTTHAQGALGQKALTSLGYDTQGADGKFGDHTLAAVKAFQQAKHLTVDGYFGKNSLAALELDMGGHLDPTPGGCIAAALDDDASTDSDTNTGSNTDDTAFVREAYDRQAALAYAAKWYAGNNPDFTWFGKSAQGQQSPVGGNGDCANFVSQCLYTGGMPMKWTGSARDRWYYKAIGGAYSTKSPSWAGAHELRRFIKYNTGSPRIAYEFLPSASGMVPGDLVFVLDRSQGEAKANAKAKHVAMVRKIQGQTIYIYSHSPYSSGKWKTAAANTLFCHLIGIKT